MCFRSLEEEIPVSIWEASEGFVVGSQESQLSLQDIAAPGQRSLAILFAFLGFAGNSWLSFFRQHLLHTHQFHTELPIEILGPW